MPSRCLPVSSFDGSPYLIGVPMVYATTSTDNVHGAQGIYARRKKHRGTDLISALITAHEGEEMLSESEILSTCELLLFAGNVTTTDLIGNGMYALLTHTEQMERLRGDAALLPGAILTVSWPRSMSSAARALGSFRTSGPIGLRSSTSLSTLCSTVVRI
jgi:hypothetical protein